MIIMQSAIFLRLHAEGFNQSINWFEQDCVDFSPASFYRAMNHSHFPSEIEKLVGRCKIPTDNIYPVFNQDWPFCLRTLYITIVSISQKLHTGTGTCISLIQQFCNIYKKKKDQVTLHILIDLHLPVWNGVMSNLKPSSVPEKSDLNLRVRESPVDT